MFVSAAFLATVVAFALLAEPASAADAGDAGKELGDMMRSLATPLLGGLAGLMCLGALVSQNFPKLLGLAGMVILIMLFLVADSPLVNIGEDTAKQINGGGNGATR